MKHIRPQSTSINWLKYTWLYFVISLLVIVPGIFSLIKWGLNPSIEFTGGSQYYVSSSLASPSAILTSLSSISPKIISTSDTATQVRSQFVSLADLSRSLSSTGSTSESGISQYEVVGSVIGRETLVKTLNALLIASILLLLFISSRFKDLLFGLSAIIATFHDSFVLLGVFSLLGHFWGIEVDTLFVTAVLTILSFSVHDTIVVFDRIREIRSTTRGLSFDEIANKATSETMVRSLNNSLTIMFTLFAMFILGGESTRHFSLALLIGTITGTYSSMFTAIPVLNLLMRRFHSR